MSRFALLLALVPVAGGLVPGCFYADPINQRPSIAIENLSAEVVHRGDTVQLRANYNDPDGHYVKFQWRAYACTDATNFDACDDVPFADSIVGSFELVVPKKRVDLDVPVESLWIVLEAKDELGATARPAQELVIPVANAAPTVVLDKSSRYKYIAGTPIKVLAKLSDIDDGKDAIAPLVWEVFPPAQLSYTLTDLDLSNLPPDLTYLHVGKVLTASGPGEWMIRVTAADALGATTTETISIPVEIDGPPCLAQLSPIVPTDGAALPITAPTLFRVPVVIDALDIFPPQPEDTVLGTTRFQWSLQGPTGGSHVAITGAEGNSYALDPASYQLGDILELRVEIFDRHLTPIPCIDSEQTCSVISQPTCIQRQTWRVEVR